jgi:hypothetical protein
MLTSENQAARSRLGADVDHKVVRRQARPGWVLIDFAELWQYRELLVFYAFRDIKPILFFRSAVFYRGNFLPLR